MPPQRLVCPRCGHRAARHRELTRHRCSMHHVTAPYPRPLLSLTIPEPRAPGYQPRPLLSLVVRPPTRTSTLRPLLAVQLQPSDAPPPAAPSPPAPPRKAAKTPPDTTPRRPSSPVVSPQVSSSQSPHDSWMEEDVCDILPDDELAKGPRTPTYYPAVSPHVSDPSPIPDTPSPPRLLTPTRFRRVPTLDAAVQVEVVTDPRDRVRRRVLQEGRPTLRLRPVPERLHSDPVDTDTRVRDDQPRRLCHCRRCVRHATRILDTDLAAEPPSTKELRFVTLPGLAMLQSSVEDRRRLRDHLRRSPQKLLLVCSCATCTSHRNLDAAAQEARKYTPAEDLSQPPPEAGGCRAPPSNNLGLL